jgi:hypothetical protein
MYLSRNPGWRRLIDENTSKHQLLQRSSDTALKISLSYYPFSPRIGSNSLPSGIRYASSIEDRRAAACRHIPLDQIVVLRDQLQRIFQTIRESGQTAWKNVGADSRSAPALCAGKRQ